MKRNVNQILLGLLFLTCIGIVGLVAYYTVTYDEITQKYEASVMELENKSRLLNETYSEVREKKIQLEKKEEVIQEYLKELNLSRTRESSLGTHFQSLKSEQDELESELSQTESEKEDWIEAYRQASEEYDVCSADLNVKEGKIEDMREMALALSHNLNLVETKLEDSQDNYNYLNNSLQDFVSGVNPVIDGLNDSSLRSDLRRDRDDVVEDIVVLEDELSTLLDRFETLEARIIDLQNE